MFLFTGINAGIMKVAEQAWQMKTDKFISNV